MGTHRIVVDTNVLVASLRSRRGAAFRLLSLVGTGKFDITLSVPLVLEYEEILLSQAGELNLTPEDVQDIVDYLCSVGHRQKVYFLWRPQLRDPGDEMVLELAVAASCEYVVTFNKRDFWGADRFSFQVVTPGKFLKTIGEVP